MLKVPVINKSNNDLPKYATIDSAGLDLRANISEPIVIKPLERKLIPTGLYISLPKGYEMQVRPRSGMAIKHGITCINTPGTIDSDYRGEYKVPLHNHSNIPATVNHGDRIAQMVIMPFIAVELEEGDLSNTARGSGGFGSTGV